VNTAETARAVNREIQWQRHGRSERGIDLHDDTTAHVGDWIATRRNDPTLRTDTGERVRNRQTWTVTNIAADGAITVQHDARGAVTLPVEYVELGWAVTGYGNQGDTVDIGIAVLEASCSRNHTYVAMTRGRHANHAILVDPTGTADPAEQLAEIIARPMSAESALAVQERLHREAGFDPPEPVESSLRPSDHDALDSSTHRPRVDPSLDEDVAKLQRRLDRLQNRSRDLERNASLGR
jgi:hypothetical protein